MSLYSPLCITSRTRVRGVPFPVSINIFVTVNYVRWLGGTRDVSIAIIVKYNNYNNHYYRKTNLQLR